MTDIFISQIEFSQREFILYLENYTLNLKLKYLISKNKFNFTDKRESIFLFMNENQEEPLFYDTLIVKTKRSSKKERRADALALRADERRDKLRKAAVRSKYSLTRRFLNGETRLDKLQSLYGEYIAI